VNLSRDETQESISNKPERYLSRRIVNPSSASVSGATVPTASFVPSNEVLAPDDRASFADRFGNRTSSESVTRRDANAPASPPEPSRPLGIFSGKPMSPSRLPPSVWGLPDNSDGSGDGNVFNFLAGLAFQNPTQPAPLQTGSKPMRSLGRRIVDQPPASMVHTPASAAPLAPSDDPDFSGGLLGGSPLWRQSTRQIRTSLRRRRWMMSKSKPIYERSMRNSPARAISGTRWRCTTP
jgi:hypothetical protein